MIMMDLVTHNISSNGNCGCYH